jgi:hypothetical protein
MFIWKDDFIGSSPPYIDDALRYSWEYYDAPRNYCLGIRLADLTFPFVST